MKPYRFLEEAEAEFHEVIAYFDTQTEGLADSFVEDVEAAVHLICEYPESGNLVSRVVRKAVLRRFRYSVLYVNGRTEVFIVAVAAHARRPNYWRKRLTGIRGGRASN